MFSSFNCCKLLGAAIAFWRLRIVSLSDDLRVAIGCGERNRRGGYWGVSDEGLFFWVLAMFTYLIESPILGLPPLLYSLRSRTWCACCSGCFTGFLLNFSLVGTGRGSMGHWPFAWSLSLWCFSSWSSNSLILARKCMGDLEALRLWNREPLR